MLVEKVKVPTWDDVYYALVDSAYENDGKKFVEWRETRIDEHFSVKHRFWDTAVLFYVDNFNVEVFDDDGAMCCEDEHEFAGECASGLLESFEGWYGKQNFEANSIADINCWDQAEQFVAKLDGVDESVYDNCCDYLYYGEGLNDLIERGHNYGLSKERTAELWKLAFWFMADGVSSDDPCTTAHTYRYVM